MRLKSGCVGVGLALLAVTGHGVESWAAQAVQSGEPAEFLEALTGQWEVSSDVKLGPGDDPVRIESHEHARLIGGRWLVAESTGSTGGTAFTSILTLGYDGVEEQLIGTWISGRQAHMWSYTGSLDASGTRLTLETEGPIMGDPDTTASYREIMEIQGPDRRVVRSLILGPDGRWFEFQRAEYRREEPGNPGGGHDR